MSSPVPAAGESAAVALVLAVFAVGYVAMARHITNAGALYAFVSRGLGRPERPAQLTDPAETAGTGP